MNLGELRAFVRAQMDVDEEELPNSLVDEYLQEAFDRTINTATRWPFYETIWDLTKAEDADTISLPTDCQTSDIMSFVEVGNLPLTMIDYGAAEMAFSSNTVTVARPAYYSVWGNTIYLWPAATTGERTYKLRGYRKPTDWLGAGTDASAEVDADERLHKPLAHYAIAMAYAQQEDEVLEDVYMKRWQSHLNIVGRAITTPYHSRPLVMNGGLIGPTPFTEVTWDLPVA